MTAIVRTLVATHIISFVVGFAAGKYIDHDELSQYRQLHESSWTRFERRLARGVLGLGALGTVAIIVRLTFAMSSTSTTAAVAK
jgi:hypothetical protein